MVQFLLIAIIISPGVSDTFSNECEKCIEYEIHVYIVYTHACITLIYLPFMMYDDYVETSYNLYIRGGVPFMNLLSVYHYYTG